jgi:hypothetical protein
MANLLANASTAVTSAAIGERQKTFDLSMVAVHVQVEAMPSVEALPAAPEERPVPSERIQLDTSPVGAYC